MRKTITPYEQYQLAILHKEANKLTTRKRTHDEIVINDAAPKRFTHYDPPSSETSMPVDIAPVTELPVTASKNQRKVCEILYFSI